MDIKTLKKCVHKSSLRTFCIKDGYISATDMDVLYYKEKHGLPVVGDNDIDACVYAPTFANLVKIGIKEVIQDDERQKLIVTLTTGVQATIEVLPTSDYVATPTIDSSTSTKHRVNRQALIMGLENTTFAVMAKNFSPVLTGVNIVIDKNINLTVTGTDSFRLASFSCEWGSNPKSYPLNIIVKVPYASILLDFLKSCTNDNTVFIEVSESGCLATFECDGKELTTLLIQGKFPDRDNEKIIPRKYVKEYSYNSKLLASKVKSLFAACRNPKDIYAICYEHCIVTDNSMEDNYKVCFDYEVNKIVPDTSNELYAVNLRYVKDFLNCPYAKDKDKIQIGYTSPNHHLVYQYTSNILGKLIYVVRPLDR